MSPHSKGDRQRIDGVNKEKIEYIQGDQFTSRRRGTWGLELGVRVAIINRVVKGGLSKKAWFE